MEKITFTSPNVDCAHCIESLRHKIGNLSGVIEVQGDPAKKEVAITYDPSLIQPDAIKGAMADAGYPAAA